MVEYPATPDEEEDEEELASPASRSNTSRKTRGVTLDSKLSVSTGKLWLTLSVPLAACEFAGNQEPWTLALVATLVGLNLLLNAPRARITRTIIWPLILIAMLLLAGLLPISATFLPDWRARLPLDFGIKLSTLLSPQPWVTFENWILFIMGLAWFLSCLGRRYAEPERRWLTRRLILGIALIAVQSLLFERFGIRPGFWQHDWPATYSGPFSSPDVLGGFLAMGSLLAIAVADDASRQKKKWFLLYALCLVPMFWALLVNSSRTGVLLLFGGLIVWTVFSSFSKRSAQRMSLFVALLLTLAALFIAFGDSLLEKLALPKSTYTSLSSQARIKLAASTLDMIGHAPLLGIGLGNFEPVFALTATSSNFYNRPGHPGSDWLWLASEAGLPVVGLLLLTVIAFIFRTGSWRSQGSSSQKHRRLRSACAVAALMVPVHGLVDVPGHQVGILFTMMLLAGLSLRQSKRESSPLVSNRAVPRIGAAIFLFGIAATWLAISLGHPVLPGSMSAQVLQRQATGQDRNGELEKAHQSISSAIAMKPLQWSYYFDRASLALPMGRTANLVLEDFSRARMLEPHSGLLCYQEALLWMRYNPKYSIPAWRQALMRDHSRANQFFAALCACLENAPELRASVRDLATDPRLKLTYLVYALPDEFDPVVQELLRQQPSLNQFTPEERLRLFRIWYEHGDRAGLLSTLDHNPIWRADGWPVVATDRAAGGDFKHACQIVMENLSPPIDGTTRRIGSLEQLQHAFLLHPTDYSYGLDLYEVEKAKNLMDDALHTLEKVSQIPGSPKKLLYDEAVILYRKDDLAKAWDKLRAYMEIRELSDLASKEPTAQKPIDVATPRSKHLQKITL